MSFASQSFKKRFEKMGDEAEGKWLEVAHEYVGVHTDGLPRTASFGLSRPPFDIRSLPVPLRYTPDFICPDFLVEVKGFGREQVLKLKDEQYEALVEWEENFLFPIKLFVWDSKHKRHCLLALWELWTALKDFPRGSYPEGKEYTAVPAEWLFDNAEQQGTC